MKILTRQIERTAEERKQIVILGDANMCLRKWKEQVFKNKIIEEELQDILNQCGLVNIDMGDTYLENRLVKDCMTIISAIDHLYVSQSMRDDE